MLLFKSNSFQNYIYLTSANRVSASIYELRSSVTSYFNLRDINNDLHTRNAELETKLANLSLQLKEYQLNEYYDSITTTYPIRYSFIMADVINNSISQPYNYITLNKGSKDGLRSEMGVVDQNGVVGIINVVSDHTSHVISLLNPNFRLSCKVKNSDYFGSLVWSGTDPSIALLEELPRHTEFSQGDSIVTSGFSAVFPEGILVGTIIDGDRDKNDNFLSIKVKLTTDFTQLSKVRIIKDALSDEINAVETKKAKDNE